MVFRMATPKGEFALAGKAGITSDALTWTATATFWVSSSPRRRNLATWPAFDQYARLIHWVRCLGAAGRGRRGIFAGAGQRSD